MIEVPILATERHGGESTTNYGSAVRHVPAARTGCARGSRDERLGS